MTVALDNRRCDRASCPAPAQGQAIVYGQDFYFCDHHAAELAVLLATLPTQALSAVERRESTAVASPGSRATTGASQRGWR